MELTTLQAQESPEVIYHRLPIHGLLQLQTAVRVSTILHPEASIPDLIILLPAVLQLTEEAAAILITVQTKVLKPLLQVNREELTLLVIVNLVLPMFHLIMVVPVAIQVKEEVPAAVVIMAAQVHTVLRVRVHNPLIPDLHQAAVLPQAKAEDQAAIPVDHHRQVLHTLLVVPLVALHRHLRTHPGQAGVPRLRQVQVVRAHHQAGEDKAWVITLNFI